MSSLAAALLLASSVLVAWVYVGYPLLALLVARVRPARREPVAALRVPVTVGIAVHNGAANIAARIADLLSQPDVDLAALVVVSDGSTDETAPLVRRIAATDPRVRLIELSRRGQSAAQSAIFEATTTEIVVLTDVETRFGMGSLAALLRPFADPRVGCVTGVLGWHYDTRTQTATHEGLYWRYEQRVRAWESDAGWLTAATGAILAVRSSLYRGAPPQASLDQMLPLYTVEAGSLVVVAHDATATDRGTISAREQFASRTRIATQGIEANLRMSARIVPWRRPGPFLAIWSHKLLRWATPWLATLAVIGGLWLYALDRNSWGLIPAAAALIVVVLAGAGFVSARIGKPIPGTGFPLTLITVNAAFAVAWSHVVTRRRMPSWEPVAAGDQVE